MNWTEIVIAVLTTVAVPLLTAVGAYVITWFKTKIEGTKFADAMWKFEDLIEEGVRKTYQTYVMKLKEEGNFTPEAQKKALEDTVKNVLKLIPAKSLDLLKKFYPDIQAWLTIKIEAMIDKLRNDN